MNNPCEPKPTVTESAHVGTVVQEYMDNLLVDLFPEVASDLEEKNDSEAVTSEPVVTEPEEIAAKPLSVPEPKVEAVAAEAPPKVVVEAKQEVEIEVKPELEPKTEKRQTITASPIESKETTKTGVQVDKPSLPDTQSQVTEKASVKPIALRYPQAPDWAQEPFDVLLFDVCGLKLAVPMEALGKIIKVDHETNQLIGRPDWFIGAYTDNDQHLYVVDTAKYIMPEKGFDLEEQGFDYVIQLQRSKWTLACKTVHSTVRIEPEQVKWRSQKGKRQWLSGTVVDHMCALIHVNSLIDLLDAEVK